MIHGSSDRHQYVFLTSKESLLVLLVLLVLVTIKSSLTLLLTCYPDTICDYISAIMSLCVESPTGHFYRNNVILPWKTLPPCFSQRICLFVILQLQALLIVTVHKLDHSTEATSGITWSINTLFQSTKRNLQKQSAVY